MAKVLFINPVVREKDSPRHVPYGMALLAALAMKEGHLVQVYDANAWRLGDDVLRQVLEADDWDVVAAGGIGDGRGLAAALLLGATSLTSAHSARPPKCFTTGRGWRSAMLLSEIS